MENLIRWSISRKNTDAHRQSVITHLKASNYEEDVIRAILPPIFFKPIDECTDDEIRLLDNFTQVFFKGEECANKLFR